MREFLSRRDSEGRPSLEEASLGSDDLVKRAEQALGEGRLAEGEGILRRALRKDSGHLGAKRLLAGIVARRGDVPTAIFLFEGVLAAEPDDLDVLIGLSTLLRASGRRDESIEPARRAASLRPTAPGVLGNLGRSLLSTGRHGEALEVLDQALDVAPDHVPALLDRGAARVAQGRGVEAAEDYRHVLALDPQSIGAHVGLGNLLLVNGNAEAAAGHFRRVAELDPKAPQAKVQLARALIEEGDFEAAEVSLREAIALAPGLAETHALFGLVLQQRGRFDEANVALERALSIQPDRMGTFYAAVNGRKVTEADRSWIERMASVDPDRLSPEERRPLHYGLGKAFDDLGEYGRAMDHFEAANRIAQVRLEGAGRRFDRERHRAKVTTAIETFTPEFFASHRNWGASSELPVLIVGMARSGTTLLEQILSSHPEVGAAGEQGFWLTRAPEIGSPDDVRRAARTYLARLEFAVPERRFVTDKMPQNFMALGPIHLSLPSARIVHCRRSPIDTCLSIFTTSFRAGPDFAHVREDLVFAYREYQRLMAHWRRTLPVDRFLEIDYENLVEDREGVARRIVGFLGLPWDASCLSHETNVHAISTPSVWQARQPVYRTSVERWRNYEPWLGALRALLDGEKA